MQQQGFNAFHQRTPTVALDVEMVPVGKIPTVLQQDDILMAVNFSAETGVMRTDPRQVYAGLKSIGESTAVEVWRGSGTVTCHREGRICWSENGEVLFGHLLVEETAANNLSDLIEAAYAEINAFLRTSDYPYAFRFWHYIPGINQVEHGIERYQAFCVGRYSEVSRQSDFERALPAASAVGTDTPGLLITFSSGTTRPLQVENPRQISAFHYPPVYSPRSPLFSRAVCMNWNAEQMQILLSGTASIVGHKTRHAGDIVAQTEETCRNINAVLDGFCCNHIKANASYISGSSLRVYLRHPEHLDIVAGILNMNPALPDNIIYLQGDLCRSELLLEVEGVFNVARSDVPG